MQTIACSKIRNFLAIVAVLSASLGFAAPAFAKEAILNPDGKLTYLHMDTALVSGINDAGQVTGDIVGHGFVTGPNGVGILSRVDGSPTSINDAGQVVGYSFTADSEYIFITGPNGVGMTNLGTLGRGYVSASGINDVGQVAGDSGTANGYHHAFITGPNGVGMTDLGTLGGANSYASSINDAGEVVGYSATTEGATRAFITGPNGVGITDLGTLGGPSSFAYGINDAGQVVGYSVMADGSNHAFITGSNGVGMIDLNSLVVNLPVPGEYFIADARGINNHGQILVYVGGVPEPETYALLLAGLTLVGFTTRLRKAAVDYRA